MSGYDFRGYFAFMAVLLAIWIVVDGGGTEELTRSPATASSPDGQETVEVLALIRQGRSRQAGHGILQGCLIIMSSLSARPTT